MPIKVQFHGRIRDIVGREELVINKEVVTVRELLQELINLLGGRAREVGLTKPEDIVEPRTRVMLIINGFSVKMLGDLDKTLTELDVASVDHIDVIEEMGGG